MDVKKIDAALLEQLLKVLAKKKLSSFSKDEPKEVKEPEVEVEVLEIEDEDEDDSPMARLKKMRKLCKE